MKEETKENILISKYKVKKENIIKLLLFIKDKEKNKDKDDNILYRCNSK
jgi:hypothetical protein